MKAGEGRWTPVTSRVESEVSPEDLTRAGVVFLSSPRPLAPGPLWNALYVFLPGEHPPENAWWFLPHRAWELSGIREALEIHRPGVVILEQPPDPPPTLPVTGVLGTYLPFPDLLRKLSPFLAPRVFVHGTLVEIFGIGVLLVGPSGVGKTECALELLHRGHFFVADDLVELVLLPEHTLGRSGSRDPALVFRAEIRGLGVVDIQKLFGWARIKRETMVDLVVELLHVPSTTLSSDRVPFNRGQILLGGRSFPSVRLPVQASKSLGPILETAVLQFRMEHNR